ncbi:MAG: hypothetical protein IH987_02055 [Planctomycetes bacterium]|nr:hypothetical protein [Planctomycetota bacterium]
MSFYRDSSSPQVNILPSCNLHGCRFVEDFPNGCPLAAANPLSAVHELQELGYQLFLNSEPASMVFHRYDTCNSCVRRLLSHPIVRQLRHDLAEVRDRASADVPTGVAQSPERANVAGTANGRVRIPLSLYARHRRRPKND